MSKENLKVVILGGGESGVGAAILAKTKGLEVFLSDKGEIKEEGTHHELIQQNGIYTKLCSMQEL